MKFRLSKREYTGPQGGVRGWRTHPRRLRPLGVAAVALGSVILPVATSPANAGACTLTPGDPYGWGNGYLVASEADISQVGVVCGLGSNYYLTANITMTPPAPGGSNHTPIGSTANPFIGYFVANNYSISGMVINSPGATDQGFFGAVGDWGTVWEFKLLNASVAAGDRSGLLVGSATLPDIEYSEVAGTLSGGDQVGGVVGYMKRGVIDTVSADVTVTGANKVGGLVGDGDWNLVYGGRVKNSEVQGTVSATGGKVGGVAGALSAGWELGSNETEADVSAGGDYAGGLAGYALGWASAGLKAYSNNASGDVSSSGGYVGGLIGYTESLDSSWGVNSASGAVTVTGSGSFVGGYIGYLQKGGWLPAGGLASGDVTAANASRVGGFLGGTGNIDITGAKATGAVTGGSHVGGLIGYMEASCCDLLNSQASGAVTATSNAGGLVGTVDGATWDVGGYTGNVTGVRIRRSKSTGSVTVGSVGGGLVGQVINAGNVIENSYSRSTVSGGGPLGGLVGKVDTGTVAGALTLTNSYAAGAVTASSGTAGGLVGSVEAGSAVTPTASFWDTATTGQATSASGTGKSTVDMTALATFNDASWSIVKPWAASGKVWGICVVNDGYPYLLWEAASAAFCMTAPTALSATPADGQATIAFTAGDDGGSTITNYEYQLDGGSWTALSPLDGTSPVTITGLTNGTTYKVKLRAVNTLGKSPESAELSVTPAKIPDAPTSLSATALDTGVKISFTAGADNGSAITNYEYQLDGGDWVALSPADGTTPVFIFGLTNSTSYSIKLRAVNAVGAGAASDPVSATPAAAPVPDGATLPELTPGSRQVVVDGTPIEVTLTVEDATDLVLKGDGFELRLAGGCTGSACELLTDGDGHPYMQLRTSGEVEVSGYGFKPNSIVNVWIFSTATYVGKLHVDGDGKFIGTLDLPPGLAIGDHTLQVNGYTPGDAQRTANMGVVLKNDQLPATGANSTWVLGITLVVLAAGAFLWAASGLGASGTTRRRRHSA